MVKTSALSIQRDVIECVLNYLPKEELLCAYEFSKKRTKLEEALVYAKQEITPRTSVDTLRRWWYHFMCYGDLPEIASRNKYHNYNHGPRYGRKSKRGRWQKRHTEALTKIVEEEGDLFLDEILDMFISETGDWFDPATIWKHLVSTCGYSLQVVTDKANQASLQDQQEYLRCIEEILLYPEMLVFLDETQKDRNSSRRRRMWSLKGQSPFRDSYFAESHSKRYTLLAAADLNGFILEACETVEHQRNTNDTDPTRGTIDADRFRIWVVQKLLPTLGNFSRGEPRSIVCLDNASIHTGIAQLIENAGARVVFTAAYSPEYNPIELMFGYYKMHLKRCSRRHQSQPWWLAHYNGLASVTPDIARSFFRRAQVPLCEHFLPIKEIETRKRKQVLLHHSFCTQAAAAAVAITVVNNNKRHKPNNEY